MLDIGIEKRHRGEAVEIADHRIAVSRCFRHNVGTHATARDRLESQGMEVVASSPEVYGEWLRTEIGKWRPIIEKLKIRVD